LAVNGWLSGTQLTEQVVSRKVLEGEKTVGTFDGHCRKKGENEEVWVNCNLARRGSKEET
jgi:hypothetical protein